MPGHFAVLSIRDGTVIGRNMQRHRHFIRCLNTIEVQVPRGQSSTRTSIITQLTCTRVSGSPASLLNVPLRV